MSNKELECLWAELDLDYGESKCILAVIIVTLGVIFWYIAGSVISLILWAIGFGLFIRQAKTYNKVNLVYKEKVVLPLFEKHFNDVLYNPKAGMNYQYFKGLSIMPPRNRYRSEDSLSAVYHGIPFNRVDLEIIEETSRDSTCSEWTYFKGAWYAFSFNKEINYELIIVEKGFRNAGGRSWESVHRRQGREQIKLEYQAFNDMFTVYAQNFTEAYYILTPVIMQNIMDFTLQEEGKVIIAFVANTLFIGVDNNRDSFELVGSSFDHFKKCVQGVEREIYAVSALVDVFNLGRSYKLKGIRGDLHVTGIE